MEAQCFECGSQSNIEFHHVVPVSLGGTRTIPLCYSCHNKVHERNGGVSISSLTKRAHRRLKDRGYRVGQHPYGFDVVEKKLVRSDSESVVIIQVYTLRAEGLSLRGIVEHLTDHEIPSRGKAWHLTTVRRLLSKDHPCRRFVAVALINAVDSPVEP